MDNGSEGPALTFERLTPDGSGMLRAGEAYLDSEGDLVLVLTGAEPGGCVVVMEDGREPFFLETPSAGEAVPEQWQRVTAPILLRPRA